METNLKKFYQDIEMVLERIPDEDVENTYDIIRTTGNEGGRIFLIGNGGSQAICSHITTDFFKRLRYKSFSLNSDGLITCLANDYGFENMYSKWLERFNLTKEDLVIGISSSGKSSDIVNGMELAVMHEAKTCFMYGFSELQWIHEHFDCTVYFDSRNYGVVELSTEIVLHGIVERLVAENE